MENLECTFLKPTSEIYKKLSFIDKFLDKESLHTQTHKQAVSPAKIRGLLIIPLNNTAFEREVKQIERIVLVNI